MSTEESREIAEPHEEKKSKKSKKDKKKKKKKKKSKEDIPHVNDNTLLNDDKIDGEGDESDDESDDGLMNIASKWAETKEDEDEDTLPATSARNSTSSRIPMNKSNPYVTPYNPTGISLHSSTNEKQQRERTRGQNQPSPYSLHITNIPYNASRDDIQKTFTEKGCQVTSIRLVYNHHVSRSDYNAKKRGENAPKSDSGFTGVAFVDLENKKSYDLGLAMDKTNWSTADDASNHKGRGWLRRRINVRPTKTKQELAQIVERTKDKMQSQKEEYHQIRDERMEREGKDPMDKNGDNSIDGDGEQKDESGLKGKKKNKSKERGKRKRKSDSDDKDGDDKDGESSPKKKRNTKKLTKKERARKAAILHSKRQK